MAEASRKSLAVLNHGARRVGGRDEEMEKIPVREPGVIPVGEVEGGGVDVVTRETRVMREGKGQRPGWMRVRLAPACLRVFGRGSRIEDGRTLACVRPR